MMHWMKSIQRAIFLAIASCGLVTGAAFANSSVSDIKEGVSAYRSGDAASAWRLLKPAADRGALKAQRYLAYIMLDGRAPEGTDADFHAGVALLKNAAMAGDYAALLRLEDLRRQHLAHSPTLDDMIEVEIARAERGDPVAAWRLARRYELGEGVQPSQKARAKWLTVAAEADVSRFPKAREAAFALCEINALGEEAADPEAARRWCAVAAENGHAGAAIVLRRLAQL